MGYKESWLTKLSQEWKCQDISAPAFIHPDLPWPQLCCPIEWEPGPLTPGTLQMDVLSGEDAPGPPGHLQACLTVHCLTPGYGPPLGACLLHRVLWDTLSTWAWAAWTWEEWTFHGWTYVEPVDICFSLLPPRNTIQRFSSFRKLQRPYLLCKALPWIFLLSSAPWDCAPL